jgi:hypothetical protein
MTGMQFQYSAVSVWSWPSGKSFNSSSNFAHGAGTFTDNISVDANDFVFGMSYVVGGASTITFEGGCTQQPTGNRNPDATDVNYFDWLIAATNASFAIQIGGTNSYQYLLANYR